MPRYQVVDYRALHGLRWTKATNFAFAAADTTSHISHRELPRACISIPVAFAQFEEAYSPIAIQGLAPGKNLLVAPKGIWLSKFRPATYDGFPFALAKVETDRYALCVDMDSGLVGECFELPFFEPNGELAKPVKDVLDFLQQVEKNRELTLRLCAALDAEGLIVPWEITVKGTDGEKKITDLYRIDEARLNSLDAAALSRIHQAGALPVAYCQLLSMQHIHTLAKLADAHAKLETAEPQPEKPNGQSGVSFLGDDGKIDFSGFN